MITLIVLQSLFEIACYFFFQLLSTSFQYFSHVSYQKGTSLVVRRNPVLSTVGCSIQAHPLVYILNLSSEMPRAEPLVTWKPWLFGTWYWNSEAGYTWNFSWSLIFRVSTSNTFWRRYSIPTKTYKNYNTVFCAHFGNILETTCNTSMASHSAWQVLSRPAPRVPRCDCTLGCCEKQWENPTQRYKRPTRCLGCVTPWCVHIYITIRATPGFCPGVAA